MQNKFSVKVGNLAQEGGGVWPNPNFYKSLFLWDIWPFFAENFRHIDRKKSQRSNIFVEPLSSVNEVDDDNKKEKHGLHKYMLLGG